MAEENFLLSLVDQNFHLRIFLLFLLIVILTIWYSQRSNVRIFEIKDLSRVFPTFEIQGVKFEGIFNFRDLGRVYKSEDGYQIKFKENRIFRCAAPVQATESDIEHLIQHFGLKKMIDMRSNFETTLFPLPSELLKVVNYAPNPLMTSSTSRMIFRELPLSIKITGLFWYILGQTKRSLIAFGNGLHATTYYRILLETAQPNILKVLRECSEESSYPIMIYCTHGRDRTGLMIALILGCLGVSKEQICAEFALSMEYSNSIEDDAKFYKMSFGPHAMWNTLEWMESNFGSIGQYLETIGFDVTWQQKLRANLLT